MISNYLIFGQAEFNRHRMTSYAVGGTKMYSQGCWVVGNSRDYTDFALVFPLTVTVKYAYPAPDH